MKIKKEGLHTYAEIVLAKNTYFLSIEYPLIQHNHPGSLLSMLIREQDGMTKLLYDISNVESLAHLSQDNKSRGNNFLKEDCRYFLISLQRLLKDVEELMLSPEHITFHPERVYRGENNNFFWMYCPDETYDMKTEVQQFFSWMLSEINYGDSETVRYIYHVYWLIRNRSFSQKLIEECLNDKEEEEKGITTYESFFAEEISKEKMNEISRQDEEPIKDFSNVKDTGAMHKNVSLSMSSSLLVFVEMALGIASVITGVTVIASVIYSLWYGEVPIYNRYWICCVIVFILLLEGVYHIHKKRTAKKDLLTNEKTQKCFPKREEDQYCEETVRLDFGIKKKQPRLKSEDSGELFLLQSFPYYIGNDKGLNQLTIYDNTVSRKHAVIKRGEEDKYFLQDLHSTNGTWINNIRISQDMTEIREGDILQFATHVYQFELAEDTEFY